LHDWWGSPTGSGHSSGVEEEWKRAEDLYAATKIRNIGLFFKKVDERQLKNPGDQLRKVLDFKTAIASGKRHLYRDYEETNQFCEHLRFHLAQWLRDHEGKATGPGLAAVESVSLSGPELAAVEGVSSPSPNEHEPSKSEAPGFDYWMDFADRLRLSEPQEKRDYPGALFCAQQALATAGSEMEWARARFLWALVESNLNEPSLAFSAFNEIANRFADASESDRRVLAAKALVNKGFMLGTMGRSEEEIGVYDDVVARFGAATELALRERVARALVNKGITLGTLDRNGEAIAVYDEVVARFGAATELALREQVAKALFGKGWTLGTLGRSEEEIGVYDDVVARFGAATELALRERVARDHARDP
jgi:tetratricopeptide (TPR) repeat protein